MTSRKPSHPDLFLVKTGPREFSCSLEAIRPFKAGEEICKIGTVAPGITNAWNTLQTGECSDDIIEMMGSDLNFVNHSCDPNIIFDVSSARQEDWHIQAIKDIRPGDTITFFYPSTEWEMAQPFKCNCGSLTCLGHITGAASLQVNELRQHGFINPHILRLVAFRDSTPSTS